MQGKARFAKIDTERFPKVSAKFGIRGIPRVKTGYQISRSIFVRVVGEYNSDRQDALRDDSRTNLPIYIRNGATGAYERADATHTRSFRADWLFS